MAKRTEGKMDSGGGQTVSQTNTSPWEGQQPYLLDVFKNAQDRYNQNAPSYYPGQTVASPSQATNYSQDYAMQLAKGLLPQIGQQASDSASYNLGPGRDLANDPYLQSAIKAASQPLIQAFGESGGPLSQIRSSLISNSGNGASSREGIAEGIAMRGLGQQLTNLSQGMTYNAYQDAQNRALQTLGLMPSIQGMQITPANVSSAVGQQRDAYSQSLIDAAMNKWNYEQQLPDLKLAQYKNLISGAFGGNSYSTGTAPSQDNTAATLGTLAMAAAIAFSDRRLKTKIRQISRLANGLKTYMFEMFGQWHYGLMADEVERLQPNAVLIGPMGYRMVKYGVL